MSEAVLEVPEIEPPQPLLFSEPQTGHNEPEKVAAIDAHEPLLSAPAKPTRKVAAKARRKCPFPTLRDIAWEWKSDKDCWQCWHVPGRTSDRTKKTYLGNFCGERLAEFLALPKPERKPFAVNWVADKRARKAKVIAAREGS